MYGTDVQLIPGKLYRSLARLPTSTGELIPGELIKAWSITDGQIAISRGDRAKAAETSLAADTFFSHCELAPEADENVRGEMRNQAPFIVLEGWKENIDAAYRPKRRGGAWLDLEELRLLCEVLATGETRAIQRQWQGRLWNIHYSLEDPRQEEEQVKTSLADQLLWFFPGGEDWTVFRMSCTTLIHGLGREFAWLLKLPEQPYRSQLNELVVLLDQATLRVGL